MLLLLCAAAALQAAPDALLFVRDGHIWHLPKDSDEPHQAVADDPGWTYTQPTWLDHEVPPQTQSLRTRHAGSR